ncbi:MAG: MerR family transcriptional regulator [Sandarakinorhabdus sp.]|nr:MerR family transcriptional regulator [Sandarakinorhabdus sp.]
MITLSITEVCRRTGLSSRTLRFYEARGLLAADRTPAGLRCYGAPALTRLHNITALKRAGFSLARIAELLDSRALDLPRIIETQLASLAAQSAALTDASASLFAAQRALAAGETLDIDTFCTLIKQGATIMTDELAWKKVADRYYTPEEQARWAEKMQDVPAEFDQQDYQAKWRALTERITAALPLDPTCTEAQAFVVEWQALLAPFTAVADAAMWDGASKLYDRIDEWKTDVEPPFSSDVWAFIKAATTARRAAPA